MFSVTVAGLQTILLQIIKEKQVIILIQILWNAPMPLVLAKNLVV